MILNWIRDRFTAEDIPNRVDICARVLALDPLPEIDRMTVGPFLVAKPKTFAAWKAKYSRIA